EKDEGQQEARKKKDVQRVLAAQPGGTQLVDRVLVHQRLAQVQTLDDPAHRLVVLRAQRRLRGFGVHPCTFTSADKIALRRNRPHALVQITLFEKGDGQRVEGCEDRNGDQDRKQQGGVGQCGRKVFHRSSPRSQN